jgi:hypothetical protein
VAPEQPSYSHVWFNQKLSLVLKSLRTKAASIFFKLDALKGMEQIILSTTSWAELILQLPVSIHELNIVNLLLLA